MILPPPILQKTRYDKKALDGKHLGSFYAYNVVNSDIWEIHPILGQDKPTQFWHCPTKTLHTYPEVEVREPEDPEGDPE